MSGARPEARLPEAAAAPIFAALGDPTRLSLIRTLSDGQTRSIASLSTGTSLTRQAITKHLRVLETAGLVQSARVGRESQFALRPDSLHEVRTYLDDVSRHWDEALGRLRAFVER